MLKVREVIYCQLTLWCVIAQKTCTNPPQKKNWKILAFLHLCACPSRILFAYLMFPVFEIRRNLTTRVRFKLYCNFFSRTLVSWTFCAENHKLFRWEVMGRNYNVPGCSLYRPWPYSAVRWEIVNDKEDLQK